MLDNHIRFKANDEIIILNALSVTELTAKKCALFEGLAQKNEVKSFFRKRASMMKRHADELRKELDRIGGS